MIQNAQSVCAVAGFAIQEPQPIALPGGRPAAKSISSTFPTDELIVRRVTKDDPHERVKLTSTLKGPRSAVKQIEGELKRVAFMHDELDVDVQVFDEGGWLRRRVVGITVEGPRYMVEEIKKQLQKYVDSM
jgi:hypothetical protein